MEIISLVSLLLAAGAITALLLVGIRLRDSTKRLKEVEAQVHSLTENLNALCSGAVGVDQRVSNLERTGRDLAHRQESIESSQPDRPYGEAIQMVQQGATASVLVQELGLSRSEADLVVMLHGSK
ncbi:DUF2802 domain-containing protein [Sedimenticola selenatireducens]|uniref:DUF2802 domain-containing protein n=1 Tax=Sedimenticola selenatireducens TaxID=191960 RepID=A0A2N6CS33_9GAMM|nr:DUF2802 domain-containing protein [Sedimenticola selenatireducens]PLX59896.1 MAG: DUF2802 domain-containing protein [Sedimenticola selenatireducens]